ncbi:MAG: aspartate-semialdehyde dehydrogenase, partial [Caldiserica bacterium]|nr:aspartate-semialdehyde dehydrogenase [Caldisericota bacterium]
MERTKAVVCGATGMVGQIYVAMLSDHPWFELVGVAASERSAGRQYSDAARWYIQGDIP